MARKPIYKYNPSYTKMTLRQALQTTIQKTRHEDLEKEDKLFIKEVLIECDRIHLEKLSLKEIE